MSRNKPRVKATVRLPIIDIVITTAGRFDELRKCLQTLHNEAQKVPFAIAVHIVDNGSDPEERLIESNAELFNHRDETQYFADFKSKRLAKNIGFPGAANAGAQMGSAPLIMFLSDDVELMPGSLEKIVRRMDDPTIGIVGIKLLFPPDSADPSRPAGKVQHIGLALDIHGNPIHALVGWRAEHPKCCISREVFAVTGACLTIRRKLFTQAQGFNLIYGRGCLVGTSLVSTDDGFMYLGRIADSFSAGESLMSDFPFHEKVSTKSGKSNSSIFHINGQAETKLVTLDGGFQIQGTLNHKLWVMNKNGVPDWKEIQELEVEDFVALKVENDEWNGIDIPDDYAYLFGLYLAEGSCEYISSRNKYSSRVAITNADPEIQEFLYNMGFTCTDSRKMHFRRGTKEFFNLMCDLGMVPESKATTKYLESSVLQWNKRSMKSMLQGMFDGDGCAIKDGRVTYSTSSIRMAKQLQTILLRFGCVTSISTKRFLDTVGYTLDFGGTSLNFYKNIGFRLPRKQNRQSLVRETRGFLIPYQKSIYMNLYNMPEKGYKASGSRRNWGEYLAVTDENVTTKKIQHLLEYREEYKDTDEYKYLDSMLKSGLIWKKVKELGNIEVLPTYDLHVPHSHNYIANGIVSHNTFEDVDLCLTVRELGSKIFMDADAPAYHYVGATAEKRKEPFPLGINSMTFKSRWANSGKLIWDEFSYW